MDTPRRSTKDQSPAGLLRELGLQILLLPLRVLESALRKIKPYTPQLFPLLFILLLIPLLIPVSIYAGYFVWRNVAVSWTAPLYLQYGDSIPPWAETELPRLVPRQRYDYSVHLTLPNTPSNFALGNFMTTLTLSTMSNSTITSIRRPSLALPPKPKGWLSGTPNSLDIVIPLLPNFPTGSSRVLARVSLGREDGWKSIGSGEGRELVVMEAYLRGHIKYHGIRGVVTRFPITFSIISSATFFAISVLGLAGLILPSIPWDLHPQSSTAQPTLPSPPFDTKIKTEFPPDDDGGDDDFRPSRSRRLSKRKSAQSLRRAPSVEIKSEAASSSTEPALRRRRSRLTDSDATLFESQ